MKLLSQARDRLARVIARGETLATSLRQGHGSDESTLLAWRLTAVTIVAHLVPEHHHYRRELGRIAEEREARPERALDFTLGVLRGLSDDLESGALGDVRGQLRRQVLRDLLDRAEDHYERGYAEAAAVLLVTILEDRLRSLCALNDVKPRRSLDEMAAELHAAGLLTAATLQQIGRWAELAQSVIQRSGPPARADVAAFLDGVARFLDDHPAADKTPPRQWQPVAEALIPIGRVV